MFHIWFEYVIWSYLCDCLWLCTGGGGYFGGGGGGAGIDGSGGGGGSSFVNTSALSLYYSDKNIPSERIATISGGMLAPRVSYVNDSAVTFRWSFDWSYALWGVPTLFEIEISAGPDSEDLMWITLLTLVTT